MTDTTKDPWLTLGQVRDDLKQARAVLKTEPKFYCNTEALKHVERALGRIGDGEREEGAR